MCVSVSETQASIDAKSMGKVKGGVTGCGAGRVKLREVLGKNCILLHL